MTASILTQSAVAIARQIREGALSPVDAVEAHITRIEQINPAINAVVTPMFEQARADAAYMVRNRPDDPPPLWGVPVTVKDTLAVQGVRWTSGYWPMRDRVAQHDAEAVARLKQAGVIILGKTNTPDLAWSVETENPIFGLTRNPHDLDYSANGSSGGEAAIIAAGGSPLGLGSDIGGSLRGPAAFCGVVSLKPTAGRIPTAGHYPGAPPALAGWNTVGPMARRVEDLALALRVLADVVIWEWHEVEVKRAVLPEYPWFMPPSSEIKQIADQALRALADTGILTSGISLPVNKAVIENAAYLHEHVIGSLWEQLRWEEKISDAVRNSLRAVDYANKMPFVRAEGPDYQEELRRTFEQAIGEGGVMIWPVFPRPPQKHGFSGGLYGSPIYTAMFNMLGLPGVVVPIGWGDDGLPLAVQVLARRGDDEVALAAAKILEDRFGGWRLADEFSDSP